MAIEEIGVFRDLPAKPGKKRRPRLEVVGKGTAQSGDVERAGQEGGSPERAMEGSEKHREESLTSQVGKAACQEIEVEVAKIPPNPRLVWVKYYEEGREHRILVHVGRNANFKPRMRLKLERPADWASRLLPWEYRGRRPRLPGRW
jgi:hypothetical protein